MERTPEPHFSDSFRFLIDQGAFAKTRSSLLFSHGRLIGRSSEPPTELFSTGAKQFKELLNARNRRQRRGTGCLHRSGRGIRAWFLVVLRLGRVRRAAFGFTSVDDFKIASALKALFGRGVLLFWKGVLRQGRLGVGPGSSFRRAAFGGHRQRAGGPGEYSTDFREQREPFSLSAESKLAPWAPPLGVGCERVFAPYLAYRKSL